MHIPDGFLDARTCAGTFCLAGAGLAWAARRTSPVATDKAVPLMGVMSAFIFAGQMVNFPVASGTSGHLLGASLAALFLGPWAAALALATVVTVQCLIFQDGGLTALGANLLNMAVGGTFAAYVVQRALGADRPTRTVLVAACSAWVSVMAAASLCTVELAASGTVPLRLAAPAMLLTHAVIGLGEAAITASIVAFVLKVRPDLPYRPTLNATAGTYGPRPLGAVFGIAATAVIGGALLLAPWASSLPDGLERVAERLQFADRAGAGFVAPAPDYTIGGVRSEWLSTLVAGALGTLVCLGLVFALNRWWRQRLKAPSAVGRG